MTLAGIWRINDRSTKQEARRPSRMLFLVVQVREDSGMKYILSRTDLFDGLDGTQ